METKSTLVGADGTVELDTEATVHLRVAVIVHPGNSEVNEAFRFHDALHDGDVLGVGLKHGLERFKDLLYRLMKFRLVWVTGYDFCIDCITGAHRHTFYHPEVCCDALMQSLSNGCP